MQIKALTTEDTGSNLDIRGFSVAIPKLRFPVAQCLCCSSYRRLARITETPFLESTVSYHIGNLPYDHNTFRIGDMG